MTDNKNKYIAMLRHESRLSEAIKLPNTAAEWQAAAEAFEALEKALQASTDLLRELPTDMRIDRVMFLTKAIKDQIAVNEAALKGGVE